MVAGVDEVGRGAWAGPVSVGVCVIDSRKLQAPVLEGLRDSKAYSESKREQVFSRVADWATAWAVGSASSQECDLLGMTAAIREASFRALSKVSRLIGSFPDHILLDGNHDFLSELGPERVPAVTTIIKGDQISASIAAASVLAKVTRDRYMRSLSPSFPAFDFESNKGYPSPIHRIALTGFGPTAIHRVSWSFMDSLVWADPRVQTTHT